MRTEVSDLCVKGAGRLIKPPDVMSVQELLRYKRSPAAAYQLVAACCSYKQAAQPLTRRKTAERLTKFRLQPGGSDVDLNGASVRGRSDLYRNLRTHRHSTCGVQARWR